MYLYFAPMEGITSYTYRNAHFECFGGADKYFAPFIVPTENERITLKTLRDLLPENNKVKVVPQVLGNAGAVFGEFTKKLQYLGYDEVNLNFGCPSGTVVKKSRGAGALKDLGALDRFLDSAFSNSEIKISVKTRTGFDSHDEFDKIMEVYNKYPITELIVHPRIREEYYKGVPNMESFDKAYLVSKTDLCYNGDVWTKERYQQILHKYPNIKSVMLGRCAVKNPALFKEIKGGEKLKTKDLVEFSKVLQERYMSLLKSEHYTFLRLKELWMLMILNFDSEKKFVKAIKKSNKMKDLFDALACLPEIQEE